MLRLCTVEASLADIKKQLTDLIGNTPIYHPARWLEHKGIKNDGFLFKMESCNVSGSVKDRAALGMLLDLEERGILKEGSTIIEPTSGNTGISLAALAASRGYKAIFTLPETMSVERRKLLAAYGAKLVLTPGADGMKGAMAKAQELSDSIENSVIPSQFSNPANPDYHEKTTGREIWEQTDGKVDVLVLGVGTGGTLTGAARYIKARKPDVEVIAVEPTTSAVISGEPAGKHGIQGLGAGFIPDNLDMNLVHRVVLVTTEEAMEEGRALAHKEGILAGISSGAALAASAKVLADPAYADKVVLTVLPDSGDRYLSTPLFAEDEE